MHYTHQSAITLMLLFLSILAFGHKGKKYDTVGYFLVMLTIVSSISIIFSSGFR